MSYKVNILKRVREVIRNTKSIKEYELLRDNLPFTGVTWDTINDETVYIAYIGIYQEKQVSKEIFDVMREIFDLCTLKTLGTGESVPEGYDIVDLEPDDD